LGLPFERQVAQEITEVTEKAGLRASALFNIRTKGTKAVVAR